MKNARLEIIALCNFAEFSQNGKVNILGIFDELYPPTFPSTLLQAFIVFVLATDNRNTVVNLELEIAKLGEKPILKAPIKMNIGGNGKGNFIFGLMNMVVPSAGTYKISVKEGTNELGFTNLNVLQPGRGRDEKSGKKSN